MCGFAELGCDLCRKYGTGSGQLDEKYRYQTVTITNSNGVETVYTPPTHSCLVCEDKKTFEQYIDWQPAFSPATPGYDFRFPSKKYTLPCSKCAFEDYKTERKKITDGIEVEKARILANSVE